MSFTYYRTPTQFEPAGDDPAQRASQVCWFMDAGGNPDARAVVEQQVALCAQERTLSVFLAKLPKDEVILDAGCGLARWVLFLRRRGYRVVGIDCAIAAVRQTSLADAHAPLVVGDTQQLPLRDAALGGVISFGVVEHDPAGPLSSLQELRRVLRPGGVALVSVPYNNLWRRVVVNNARRLRDWRKRRAGLHPEFAEYRFSAGELCGFLRRAGFEIDSVHADDFEAPLAKGLWADSPTAFGYLVGEFGLAAGHGMWELNRWGRGLQTVANAISPWLVAGGVMVVARRPS